MTTRRAVFAIVLIVFALVGVGVSYATGWNRWVVGAFVVAWFGIRFAQRRMKG